ncbi:MAG: biotin--[acetyl-CoA-carboxylase] ligase [Clostridiaceae bacterium]|nr:biotin--[acetyl-CoA-carboxylase] ligase [Clostridiaceae bacterium]
MKREIVKALREAGEGYVSGSALCERLGVSRQAVWKCISGLKEDGYQIESVSGKGYRLKKGRDRLYGPDILSRLPEDCLCRKVQCFEEIDSTNTRMKQLAELGEEQGSLLVSERQTAGRGRRGRTWRSEAESGIYMTLLLRPELPPAKVPAITLLAALALTKAIQEVCGVEAQIKWPNDVVIAKKKICGILTEMSSEENYVHYVAVGIGINVNTESFPEELCDRATSIRIQTGKKTNRNELAAAVIKHLCADYERFEMEQDFSVFVPEYNRVLANCDQQVKVYYGTVDDAKEENIDIGIARGIDRDGALLVELDTGVKKIVSGEVSVRGMYGYL